MLATRASMTCKNTRGDSSVADSMTWTLDELFPEIFGDDAASQQVHGVAFDSRGNVYVSYVLWRQNFQSGAVVVAKSTDGGETFSQVSLVQPPNALNDHPFLAVDTNAGSPYRDTVYLSWTNRGFEPTPFSFDLRLSRSTDGGQTWSPPVKVDEAPAGLSVAFSDQAIGPDGTLHIAWTGDINDLRIPILLMSSLHSEGLFFLAFAFSPQFHASHRWSPRQRLARQASITPLGSRIFF